MMRAVNNPWRRLRYRRDGRKRSGPDCGDCLECPCDLFLIAPLALLRVVVGAFAPSAVDPYVAVPARRGGRAAARLIRSYQLHVSVPRARPVCPMTPTCSRYGLQAVSRHGLLRGGWLVVGRLRRCSRRRPGLDPVPPAR
jgi:putative membrane protein insertion efficiency factor